MLAAATALWGLAFLLPWQGWEIVTGRAHLPSGIPAITATLYLGIVASGGTLLLWTFGAARTPAGVSGVMTAAIPVLGYALAVFTGEQPTASKTAGGILAVTGVLLAAYPATRSPSRRPQPAATSSG